MVEQMATFTGASGADTFSGSDGADSIIGNAGSDTLSGGGGNDTIYGGTGTDSISGDGGSDSLFGDNGNDTVSGGAGNDSIDGGQNNDLMYGGGGDDRFYLSGVFGFDTIYGGETDEFTGDTIDASALNGALKVTFSGPESGTLLHGNNSAKFYEIENFVLTGYNDTLDATTSTSGTKIDGGAGDDSLAGGFGADFLVGGDGLDTLIGGDGNDTISGGAGNDLLDGGNGADSLDGGDGADVIDTGADADTIVGGIGDTVSGGEGGSDQDTLDLSAWGWSRTNIIYDPLNHENGTVQFLDANGAVTGSMNFSNIETVVTCFTPGTRIMTDRGEVAVEVLRAGDLVLTRDHGLQPLAWAGSRRLSLADLVVHPALRPIRIAAGALGANLPERDMQVSPQHRMLVEGARAEMLFGDAEVLVAATHLTALSGVEQVMPTGGVTYIHLLFAQHEIVQADGAWSESFQPAARTLSAMDADQRAEIEALFPELSHRHIDFPAARLTLKGYEARALLAA